MHSVWVVVLIQSGIPTVVEAYSKQEDAENRAEVIKEKIDENDDVVEAFEAEIDSISPDF